MKTALHIAANVLVVAGLLWACRFVYRRSKLAGLVFAAGLLVRAVGAAVFLGIWYFELPVMTGSQIGGGFYALAPDAQEYYRLSLTVLEQGAYTITYGYTLPLALFMGAVGATPAAPVLFGLIGHAVAVVAIVAAFGRDLTRPAQRARDLAVAAFSLSPMLIYSGVFGTKDVFTTMLIVVAAVAYRALGGTPWTWATLRTHLPAAAAAGAAIWLLAAIRTYFALLLWGATALAVAGAVIGGRPSRLRAALQGAIMLTVLWLVLGHGSISRYPEFAVAVVASVPKAVIENKAPVARGGIEELDRRRRAIEGDGGNTVYNRHTSTGVRDRTRGLTLGLGGLFIPISVLKALALVDIDIRFIARLVADADTLMIDLSGLLVLWLLWRNRERINPDPLIFAAALVLVVALPMAYVVTNYGMLVRLRLMVAAPLWLLTLALAPGMSREGARPQPDPAVTPL